MTMKRHISRFISICTVLAAGFWLSGCQEEILEEEVIPLEISYEAITGVIPNGSAEAVPEVTSGEPSDFAISEMFHGETAYEGSEFAIDSKTGTITVQGADDTDTGEYLLTITCKSGGRSYILKNALSVTFISGMPQLSMSQRTINVRFEDLQAGSTAELATSQVTSTGIAATITGYELRNVRFRGAGEKEYSPVDNGADGTSTRYFEISQEDGTVSMIKGDAWELGTFVMDIKVNTESYGSEDEEGLLTDALTVNVAAEEIIINYPEPLYLAPNITRTYTPTVEGPEAGGPQVENYEISGVTLDGADFADYADIFSINASTGVVTAEAGETITAGDYAVSISYTYAGQTLEAADVLVIDCRPGVPASISVSPSVASIEIPNLATGSAADLPSFRIMYEGETADITGYEIAAIKLDGMPVLSSSELLSIDSQTGEITIVKGNVWKTGTYTVDVRISTESTDASENGDELGVAENALTINVVEEMVFNYDAAETSRKFATGWTVEPVSTLMGATYSWTDPSAEYTKYLTLDSSTGKISAVKGNLLPESSYQVGVKATLSGAEPVNATYALEITDNPYYFTYFSYGNNLDLSEEETDGVSQFRSSRLNMPGIDGTVKYTDLSDEGKSSTKWTMETKFKLSGTVIDENTGTLTFSSETANTNFQNYNCGVLFVTAVSTDPEDSNNSWSVKMPVFVHFQSQRNGVGIQYNPFVVRVNPNSTEPYVSVTPELVGNSVPADRSLFLLNYRRDFYYWDIEDSSLDSSGSTPIAGSLLAELWSDYGTSNGSAPVSYYNNNYTAKDAETLARTLAYIDNSASSDNRLSLVVNSQNWKSKSGHTANGIFYAQMTFTSDGIAENLDNNNGYFPIIIWLDPTFNE